MKELDKLVEECRREADGWDSWNKDHPADACVTTPILLRRVITAIKQSAESVDKLVELPELGIKVMGAINKHAPMNYYEGYTTDQLRTYGQDCYEAGKRQAANLTPPDGDSFGGWAAWMRDNIVSMCDPYVQGPHAEKLAAWLDELDERKQSAAGERVDSAATLRWAATILELWEGEPDETGYMGDFGDACAVLNVLADHPQQPQFTSPDSAAHDGGDACFREPDRHCQNGRSDICLASQRDGVICPEDECDIDTGQRQDHTKAATAIADASKPSHAEQTLQAICDLFGIGIDARQPTTILTNIKNVKRFADYLHAIEREFFMVPGELDDDYPDDEPEPECLLNCWGSSQEEYVEQFRSAFATLTAAPVPVEGEDRLARLKSIITETIGFEFARHELQPVNADDLLRLAEALSGPPEQPAVELDRLAKFADELDTATRSADVEVPVWTRLAGMANELRALLDGAKAVKGEGHE
jgi:hypothetical protein